MERRFDRKLVIETGEEYYGAGFGARGERVCELVFNTSMAGYQEIISDPSYTDQAVVMTYPLIGNYGITDEDFESRLMPLGALIVRECNEHPSNFRCTYTLSEILEENGVPGLAGVDTRMLTRSIRDHGSRRALITDAATPVEQALRVIRETPVPHDAVARVSCRKRRFSRTAHHRFHVAAIDCGIKQNIVRSLNASGCNVTLLPWNAAPEQVRALRPDGLFLSNGPGDPQDARPVIELVRALRGELPMFGVCLGHQIIALAYGAATYKLKFGHRGGNHPVKNLESGRIEITSQNHSYAVDAASLSGTGLMMTHVNLLDNTVEGVRCARDGVFSVQYHPESAPGPQDSAYLFARFIDAMRERKRG